MAKTTDRMPLCSIETLTEYVLDSEVSNFFDSDCPDGHVFWSALLTAKWLSTHSDTEGWAERVESIEERIGEVRDGEHAA